MRRLVTVAITLVALSSSMLAHAQNALNGAWRATEVVVTGGEGAGTYTDVDSLIIFSEEHYSVFSNVGERPEVPEGTGRLSDELALASFRTFRANAGRYNVSGGRLTRHFMLARNPRAVGVSVESEYERRGDTLIITTTNEQGVTTRTTYIRAERLAGP